MGIPILWRPERRKEDGRNLAPVERWASAIAGGSLALYGMRRRGVRGWALATMGGALIERALTGHCHAYAAFGITTARPAEALEIDGFVTIPQPRAEVYGFWRDVRNLPRVLRHLESVTPIGPGRSHWVASFPGLSRLAWDAEIAQEHEDNLIVWRSLHGSPLDSRGTVTFADAPGGGTAIHVALSYRAPGGPIASAFATHLGRAAERQVREDLRRMPGILAAGRST
jgi:uncharacterized membrane protein